MKLTHKLAFDILEENGNSMDIKKFLLELDRRYEKITGKKLPESIESKKL